jgi:hypothetical protein
MKRAFPFLLLATIACASRPGATSSAPGHGAISLAIVPNPIVARPVSGATYDFPFDVVVRETGGRPVRVSRVTLDVYALGAIRVGSESYDSAQMEARGLPTSLPANGELRYHFAPRKNVTDERLFGGVTGEVRVEAADDAGAPAGAQVSVSVTR